MDDARAGSFAKHLAPMPSVVGLVVPFVAAVVFHFAGSIPRPIAAGAQRPALAFDQYLVDLGEVPATEEITAHFDFTNRGQSTVKITELVPSCGCLNPQLTKHEFEPGEAGGFVLRVKTPNETPGQKEYLVTVKYTDPEPREVVVSFRVVLPDNQVYVRPRALAIYQSGDQPTTHEIEIIDYRPQPLAVEKVECLKRYAQVELGGTTADDEGHWHIHLTVTVSGSLRVPRLNDMVRIITSDPDYSQLRVPLIIQSLSPKKVIDNHVQPAGGTRR